jgi:hypothetical protein
MINEPTKLIQLTDRQRINLLEIMKRALKDGLIEINEVGGFYELSVIISNPPKELNQTKEDNLDKKE